MSFPDHTVLTDEARTRVGELLNHALAEESALSVAARDYHWHVSGPQFRSLHEVFDQQHRELDGWVERLGERARGLGVAPRASWNELLAATQLRPARGADLNASCMLAEMIGMHDHVADWLRSKLASDTDAATAELLHELVEYHETAAWMLGELIENHELAQA
ncbi:Dps family protein [Opitutus terrae]|uniref:Ferritin Dps family protein n=1 Tax=Opitutus terrae (strain DSM 11246 / JCM 15787 / PB90-1) TaxID=452637 RepID=B1ZTH1_OPITP|nr:DNA starvation/stationary phase protection protein [Opitutus terrae]ACB73916.1 Ferritin Dps family protein [Opitutus terrae PB90-1]